ncbi:hypothetical protein M758_8G083300 [Ceratodon purpureus]|nr:hypothetical protein M758_8G083300 [Ceratodon purpureus]
MTLIYPSKGLVVPKANAKSGEDVLTRGNAGRNPEPKAPWRRKGTNLIWYRSVASRPLLASPLRPHLVAPSPPSRGAILASLVPPAPCSALSLNPGPRAKSRPRTAKFHIQLQSPDSTVEFF